jgi:hypothetical protein
VVTHGTPPFLGIAMDHDAVMSPEGQARLLCVVLDTDRIAPSLKPPNLSKLLAATLPRTFK